MSHTLDTRSVLFHHDGDFGGTVQIALKQTNEVFAVDVADLLEFAAALVRNRRIEFLEQASTEDVLFAREGDRPLRQKTEGDI